MGEGSNRKHQLLNLALTVTLELRKKWKLSSLGPYELVKWCISSGCHPALVSIRFLKSLPFLMHPPFPFSSSQLNPSYWSVISLPPFLRWRFNRSIWSLFVAQHKWAWWTEIKLTGSLEALPVWLHYYKHRRAKLSWAGIECFWRMGERMTDMGQEEPRKASEEVTL